MANSVPYFNDGEALDHTDLNETVSMLANNASMADYETLVRNYVTIVGGTYATIYAAGLQAIGFDREPVFTLASGSISMAPQRMYVGLGDSPHSGTDSDRILACLDMPTTSVVVPANATGSQRTDTLSIPATEATLFAAGTSESRDFQDAVTGALSSQSVNKRYAPSTALTYTAGGSAPANHATIATFTVPNASSTPTLQYRHWVPMGRVVTQYTSCHLMANVGTWTSTGSPDTGVVNSGTAYKIGHLQLNHIPARSFVTTCALIYKYMSATTGQLEFVELTPDSMLNPTTYSLTAVTLEPVRAAVTSLLTLENSTPADEIHSATFVDFVHDYNRFLKIYTYGTGADPASVYYVSTIHVEYR